MSCLRGGYALVLLSCICLLQQCAAQGAFLQQQLPLKVLVTTPTAIAAATSPTTPAVTLTGRQALTVVFSRPVIALGSDWGSKELPRSLVPFTLSCGTPGRLRWVTSNIARFDPSVEWPTDLACTFDWNQDLKTFDGAPLVLDDLNPSVKLATQPLSMTITSVISEAANKATDGQWSATIGLPDDKLPEVPPGANITLSFSYPVDLALLAKSLKLAGPGSAGQSISISPCITAPPPLWPIIFTANGQSGTATADASPADQLQLNSTCAVVKLVPGLAAGAAAILRLPAGSKYSSVAGAIVLDTDVQVYGLRAFRIPLSWEFMNITETSQPIYNGVKYRRLTLWLPHGLASGTKLESIKPLIKICSVSAPLANSSACQDQQFTLSRPTLGTLVMNVPALAPRQRYMVTVKAEDAVKDAFGLPLQASANMWWTLDLDGAYQGPNLNQVALLETADSPLTWPWVSRGKPEEGVNKIQAWEIAVPAKANSNSHLARAIAGMSYSYAGTPSNAFGPADQVVTRPASTSPTIQALLLPGKAGMSFVGSCCRKMTWPTTRQVFASSTLVVQSDLQAAFVQQDGKTVAWVTTTQGESKPVQGADVQVYLSAYNQDAASQGPSCTTGADGTCTLNIADTAENFSNNQVKSAVITKTGHGPLIVPSLSSYFGQNRADVKYSGALVLDRQVVKPGDDLHVTAYFQRQSGTKLEIAKDVTSVILQINPPFDPAAPGGSTRITAPVDITFGSTHAVIPVPANATAASYTINLYTIDKSGQISNMPRPVPLAQPAPTAAAAPRSAAVQEPESAAAVPADGVVPPKLPAEPVLAPGVYIAGSGFTVADPRPPTAELTITAPNWVKPADSVRVSLKAESYVGSDVSGANMTIAWETGKAKGTLEVSTNASGVASGAIQLGKLPAANLSEPGDELKLTATWIGPTREPIIKSKTIRIADGPVHVELARTLEMDIPGIPFGVKADAFSNEDNSSIAGVDVEVTLAAANGTSSLTNCTSEQIATLSSQNCSIKSGSALAAASCQLSLPCMGQFEIRGCTAVNGSNSCGAPVNVGKNATWWEASPWSAGPQIRLLPDKQNVTLGGDVKLIVQNPWWGPTSGLLVWGNAVKKVTRTLPEVPPGVSVLTISDIGEECRGSCRVMLVLAVARPPAATAAAAKERRAFGLLPLARNILPFTIEVQTSSSGSSSTATSSSSNQSAVQSTGQGSLSAAAGLNLPDIPTSKLFDPLAPRTVSAEVTLSGPQTETLEADLEVKGQGKTADGTALFTPKTGKGSIYVTVKDNSGKAAAGAEVTVLVVDKAFLDLMPYPLQNVRTAVAPDMSTIFSLTELNAFRTSRAAINTTFSTLQRRLVQLDPWLPVDTDVTPRAYYPGDYITPPTPAAVDIPDWKYLATFTTPITVLPSKPCLFGQICPAVGLSMMFGNGPVPMMAAEAVASDAFVAAPRAAPASNGVPFAAVSKSAAATTVASSAQQAPPVGLRVEGDFKVTALFTTVKAGSDGRAVASFIAPDNLGQFVVRAYAAAPKPAGAAAPVDVVYGAAEGRLLVRRQVSLTPSLPRQVRAGDNFTAGVLVESPGITAETKVTVTAALVAAANSNGSGTSLSLNGPASVTVTLDPSSTQQEARFNFKARSIGTQNISFTAAAAEDNVVADRVQLTVPVLGKQSPVWIATSFAVRGSNSSSMANRVEGLALPAAENGSGSISLVAGVGYLPAVQGTYEALVRQGINSYQDCPSGTNAVVLSVVPSMISLYHTPGSAADSYLTQNQVNVTLKAMTQAVKTLTDDKYGLLPQEPRCLYPFSRGPERADISLNGWAVWLVDQLDAVGSSAASAKNGSIKPQIDTKLASGWGALDSATKTWRKALEAQLVADAVAARTAQPPRVYDDYDALSWARLVLGAGWVPQGASTEVQKDLSMQRLLAAVNNATLGLPVGVQARAGLTLLESKEPGKAAGADVTKIAQRLLSNVRVGGRTAYVATGDGDRGAAGLSDQSLALMLFVKSGTDNPLIQKIAAWVGQGAAPPPFRFSAVCINTSPWEAALRTRALSFYDQTTSSTTPNIALTAVAAPPAAASTAATAGAPQQQVQLLSARFNASNAGSVARSTRKWEVIPAGSNLVFNAKGSGEVSIAASLNFTPAELLPFPTYRGLWVQRIVQLSSASGGSITGVGLGKMVTVAVQVTSPDDQSDVVVEVLMPGGLEPLDPNVFTDADVATICSSSEDESNLETPSSGNAIRDIMPLKRGPAGAMQINVGPRVAVSPGFNGVSNMVSSDVGSSSSRYIGWWTPWPVCPQQVTVPSVVTFTFSYFRAGTQTIRFRAIAATSGVFNLPPVKAYVQRQPEVMGLSPAGVFTVCPTAADCPAAQLLMTADPAAKACPKDCSGNGACNLGAGVCICDSGFSGPECSVFSVA